MRIKKVLQKLAQLRDTNNSEELKNNYLALKSLRTEFFKNHLIKKYSL